jgi:hypothetical protein
MRRNERAAGLGAVALVLLLTVVVAMTTISRTTARQSADGERPASRTPAAGWLGNPADGRLAGPDTTGVPQDARLRPSGDVRSRHDGEVLDGLDVTGNIVVLHDDVTVRRTRVRPAGGSAIMIDAGAEGTVIEDCELDGSRAPTTEAAVGPGGYVLRRCNIHHFAEGPRANGSTVIEACWIHDFLDVVRSGGHQDGIQTSIGTGIRLVGNTIDMDVSGGNSAIQVGASQGPVDDVFIADNRLSGGSYTLRVGAGDNPPNANPTRVTVIDNVFDRKRFPRAGYYGPWTLAPGSAVSGNTFDDGSEVR